MVTHDPKVPHSAFSSNEAAFMLVPSVDSARVVLSAGAPRTLTLEGARLVSRTPGGETLIGRSVVSRDEYLSEDARKIVVPVPTSLPAQGVHVLVGGVLSDPLTIGNAVHTLRIDIGGDVRTVSAVATLPASLPRDAAAAIVTAMVRDAAPRDPRFARARAALRDNRLVVVPGDLVSPLSISSPGALTFAAALGLTAAPAPGDSDASVSGDLSLLPALSAPVPRVQVRVGVRPPVVVELNRSGTVTDFAADLQAKIRAASADPAYTGTRVLTIGSQLLVIPGTAGAVSFAAAAGDPTTVAELQLHALFPVRVRANGAESIDVATVELPQ